MKKIFSIVLAVMASVFFCNAALAKNVDTIKLSAMTQLPVGSSTEACYDPYGRPYPTCITIFNFSSYPITIFVPVLDFNRGLNSGWQQSIIANDSASKQVILYDWRGAPFFNAYVPSWYNLEVRDGRTTGTLVTQAK